MAELVPKGHPSRTQAPSVQDKDAAGGERAVLKEDVRRTEGADAQSKLVKPTPLDSELVADIQAELDRYGRHAANIVAARHRAVTEFATDAKAGDVVEADLSLFMMAVDSAINGAGSVLFKTVHDIASQFKELPNSTILPFIRTSLGLEQATKSAAAEAFKADMPALQPFLDAQARVLNTASASVANLPTRYLAKMIAGLSGHAGLIGVRGLASSLGPADYEKSADTQRLHTVASWARLVESANKGDKPSFDASGAGVLELDLDVSDDAQEVTILGSSFTGVTDKMHDWLRAQKDIPMSALFDTALTVRVTLHNRKLFNGPTVCISSASDRNAPHVLAGRKEGMENLGEQLFGLRDASAAAGYVLSRFKAAGHTVADLKL